MLRKQRATSGPTGRLPGSDRLLKPPSLHHQTLPPTRHYLLILGIFSHRVTPWCLSTHIYEPRGHSHSSHHGQGGYKGARSRDSTAASGLLGSQQSECAGQLPTFHSFLFCLMDGITEPEAPETCPAHVPRPTSHVPLCSCAFPPRPPPVTPQLFRPAKSFQINAFCKCILYFLDPHCPFKTTSSTVSADTFAGEISLPHPCIIFLCGPQNSLPHNLYTSRNLSRVDRHPWALLLPAAKRHNASVVLKRDSLTQKHLPLCCSP